MALRTTNEMIFEGRINVLRELEKALNEGLYYCSQIPVSMPAIERNAEELKKLLNSSLLKISKSSSGYNKEIEERYNDLYNKLTVIFHSWRRLGKITKGSEAGLKAKKISVREIAAKQIPLLNLIKEFTQPAKNLTIHIIEYFFEAVEKEQKAMRR